MTRSFKRISPLQILCGVVAAAFGFAPLFCGTLFQVQAQAAPQAATVHVDVTPEHVLNTIYPDTATGAWMDDLDQGAGGQPEQARDDSGDQKPGLGFHHHAQQQRVAPCGHGTGTRTARGATGRQKRLFRRQRRTGRADPLRLFLFAAPSRLHDQRRFTVGGGFSKLLEEQSLPNQPFHGRKRCAAPAMGGDRYGHRPAPSMRSTSNG